MIAATRLSVRVLVPSTWFLGHWVMAGTVQDVFGTLVDAVVMR